jgi:glycosyltransferase involved in cell wall biosynthesis
LGIDSKNVTVIYNGIDLDRFMKDATFDFNFFNRKSFILMQISRFTESKDQETVIRALKHLPDVIKLVLVGSGETLKKNQAIVLNLNLTERVKFLGDRSDVPELIAYSSVIVQSSFYEGFGLAALEGMSSERPVIGSNVSGLVELLSGWGLLFECGNDVELADIIYKLYTERDYYNHIARRCYLRSREYSIEKMVSKYVEEYKKFKY